jgi:hypothetical protein
MGSSLERRGRARFRLPGRMLMAGVGAVTLVKFWLDMLK